MRRNPIPNQPFILLAVVALAAVGATVTSASQDSSHLAKGETQSTEVRQRIDATTADRSCVQEPCADAKDSGSTSGIASGTATTKSPQ